MASKGWANPVPVSRYRTFKRRYKRFFKNINPYWLYRPVRGRWSVGAGPGGTCISRSWAGFVYFFNTKPWIAICKCRCAGAGNPVTLLPAPIIPEPVRVSGLNNQLIQTKKGKRNY